MYLESYRFELFAKRARQSVGLVAFQIPIQTTAQECKTERFVSDFSDIMFSVPFRLYITFGEMECDS